MTVAKDKQSNTAVRLDPAVHNRLRHHSVDTGVPASKIANEAIRKHLDSTESDNVRKR